MVLRALTGFGLGGALPLDFALYAEYLPSRNRGRNLVLLESFWALGHGRRRRPGPAAGPHRGLAAPAGLLALAAALVFWIRRQVPESPRYLAASGHAAQARQVLAQVAEANRQPLPAGELQAATRGPAVRMASLWSRPYRDPR